MCMWCKIFNGALLCETHKTVNSQLTPGLLPSRLFIAAIFKATHYKSTNKHVFQNYYLIQNVAYYTKIHLTKVLLT